MSKTKIMIVEDEIISATLANKALMGLGYSVCSIAANAKDAVKFAYRDRPDLILMDVELEGDEDGIQAAALLKRELDIPVIFLTSYSDDERINRAKITEPFGYLIKPIKERELHAVISTALFKKNMERKLKESELKFEKLVRFSRDIILVIDINGTIKYCSDSIERILGYKCINITGKNISDFIYEDDREIISHDLLYQTDKFGYPKAFEIRIKRADGSWVYIEAKANVLLDDEQIDGIVVTAYDISERINAREEEKIYIQKLKEQQELLHTNKDELEKANERLLKSEMDLKESNKSKDKLMSIIAHDLRSPFIALLGFSQMLIDEFPELDKETMFSYLQHVNTSTKNIYDLMETLLQWARLQSATMDFDPQKINLHNLVEKTGELMLTALAKKEILFTNTVDPTVSVFADQMMTSSIFQNLLSNSIKFTNKCGYIKVSAKTIDNFTEITIEDTGVGFKPEHIQRILNDQFNISTIGTAEERGSGLGLRLFKEQVEKQGGRIIIKSELGKGTQFIFTLPGNKID